MSRPVALLFQALRLRTAPVRPRGLKSELMPVVIGAPRESDFTEPFGLLSDCHRRIERFLQALLTLSTELQGGPLTPQQRASLEAGLRYFRETAPRHTSDEEESLFPRLRSLDSREAQDLLSRIDSLERDHHRANRGHREVERIGQAWLVSGQLPADDAARLAALLADLSELYRGHIALEDREVFPAAQHLISEADRLAIGREMAQRRGIGRPSAK